MGNHHSRAPKHHEDRVGNLNSTGADAAAAATPNPPEDANTAPRIDDGSDGSSGESPRRHHLRSHVYQEELGGTVRVLVLGNEGVGKTEVIKHLPTHFSAKEVSIHPWLIFIKLSHLSPYRLRSTYSTLSSIGLQEDSVAQPSRSGTQPILQPHTMFDAAV